VIRLTTTLFVILSFASLARAGSVTVTNVAGRALSGELVAVTDRTVRLRLGGGVVRDIPLQVLSAGEAERLRRLAGVAEAPSPVAERLERNRALELARIDARVAAGTLSTEEAVRKRSEINAWTELRIKKTLAEEKR